jgi:K+-transporting ATPase KdpF subunit
MISGVELAGALISACLLTYLSAALLKPEWFE